MTEYVLTRFFDYFEIDGKFYLLNLINGTLLELDCATKDKFFTCVRNQDVSSLTPSEMQILRSQEFLVLPENDNKQVDLNFTGYVNSKTNQPNKLKLDIPISNRCNFICPYCFERDTLGQQKKSPLEESLKKKFQKDLILYIDKVREKCAFDGIEIVWYGGEPLTEATYLCELNDKLLHYSNLNGTTYSNTIVTNGYLLSNDVLEKLRLQNVRYIQVTIDGVKEKHNARRTTRERADTYSVILHNINSALSMNFEIVIRINVDKSNYATLLALINDICNSIDNKYFGKHLFLSFGRVFGSDDSYSLSEYEKKLKPLYLFACEKHLIHTSLTPYGTGAFCSAETQCYNMTVDVFGNIYKCWNDVFCFEKAVSTLAQYNPESESCLSQNNNYYIKNLSLENTNNGRCLKCKYFRYCKGFCPSIRDRMSSGLEENLYENNKCEYVIHERLETLLTAFLMEKKS